MFEERPVLVFWETTRACPLACLHCRASAIPDRLPDELSGEEGHALIDRLRDFGTPYPTLILTGGDPLRRPDLFALIEHARAQRLHVAVSPAVSDALNAATMARLAELGVASISVSLDGGSAAAHERVRGVPGHFERTRAAITTALDLGLRVQVNSTVMAENVRELPSLFESIVGWGVRTWEVFFLIRTGRGVGLAELSSEETEDVGQFLYDASRYGVLIRPVEAPFLRRIRRQREAGGPAGGPLYAALRDELARRMGPGTQPSSIAPRGTLDGDGILFVGYDGTIYPGGFLPERLGNVRRDDLVSVYRDHPLLQRIRARDLGDACGTCPHRFECGGSRARAFARTGDPLAADPACHFAVPVRVGT